MKVVTYVEIPSSHTYETFQSQVNDTVKGLTRNVVNSIKSRKSFCVVKRGNIYGMVDKDNSTKQYRYVFLRPENGIWPYKIKERSTSSLE